MGVALGTLASDLSTLHNVNIVMPLPLKIPSLEWVKRAISSYSVMLKNSFDSMRMCDHNKSNIWVDSYETFWVPKSRSSS